MSPSFFDVALEGGEDDTEERENEDARPVQGKSERHWRVVSVLTLTGYPQIWERAAESRAVIKLLPERL